MYDLCILGGGPGGYNAAIRAGKAGLKTILIEQGGLGGVCVNEGCIPSKTLLHTGKMKWHTQEGKAFAFSASDPAIDQGKLIKRKNRIVKRLSAGIKMQVTGANVEILTAKGEILGKDESGNLRIQAGDQEITARKLMIATGSSAMIIPFTGVDAALESGFALTNREILDLTEVPETLLIIGGGVIGLEMASYYAMAGSKVIVIEMLDHIAGYTDREIGQILQTDLEKLGITFYLQAKVTELASDPDGNHGKVIFEKDGEVQEVEGNKVLLSIGRRPNTQGFGLETLDLAMNRSAIQVDDHQLTSCPNVYAIGDVVGGIMLAHVAYREGEVAIHHILGQEDSMDTRFVPSVIYTDPEVGSAGVTEEELDKKDEPYRVFKAPMTFSGRYQAETERGDGICKIIVQNKKMVGCHVISPFASEFIVAAVAMMQTGLDVQELTKIIFPHPTVGEILRELLFEAAEELK